MTIQRKTAEFSGGDLKGFTSIGAGVTKFCDKQPVKIIREIPDNGNEDDEDRFEVEFANLGRTIVDGCDLHPHPHQPATNVEFITDLMDFSQNGALMQPFILEAVRIYGLQVLQMSEEDRAKMDRTLLPYGPWAACAEEALAALKARK